MASGAPQRREAPRANALHGQPHSLLALKHARHLLDAPPMHGGNLERDLETGQLRMLGQPGLSATDDAPGLLVAHRLGGKTERCGAPHLHLAEDEPAPSPRDDVELAAAGPRVAREDPVAAQDKVAMDEPLGLGSRPAHAAAAGTAGAASLASSADPA